MHREPDVGFDPGSPGLRPGPKAGAKPLRHPGIPIYTFLSPINNFFIYFLKIWFLGSLLHTAWSSDLQPQSVMLSTEPTRCPTLYIYIFFFKILFIYSWQRGREREREAETQAEGDAGSMLGARRGTRSWNSGTMPWAKGRHQTAEPTRDPLFLF